MGLQNNLWWEVIHILPTHKTLCICWYSMHLSTHILMFTSGCESNDSAITPTFTRNTRMAIKADISQGSSKQPDQQTHKEAKMQQRYAKQGSYTGVIANPSGSRQMR